MPTIRWFPRQGPPRAFPVYKPVTTLGSALGNDVALDSADVADHHAQIVFDGRDFNLEEIDRHGEILINAKKKRRSRLVHGDRITLGSAELSFSIFADFAGPAPPAPTASRVTPIPPPATSATRPGHASSLREGSLPVCASCTNSAND